MQKVSYIFWPLSKNSEKLEKNEKPPFSSEWPNEEYIDGKGNMENSTSIQATNNWRTGHIPSLPGNIGDP